MATALGFPAELVSAAQCWRCGGLMVPEQCFDLLSDSGHIDFLARRCVQCGELVDPIIFQNRHRLPLVTAKRAG